MQARDLIDDKGEDGRDNEGVGGGGDDVRELDVQLFPVVLDPAERVPGRIYPVERDNVVGAEDGVGEEAEHTGDAVLGKDVHAIIDADPVLDCEGMLAINSSYETNPTHSSWQSCR